LIPLLTADKNGISFDLVIPSIPGFGFSDKPVEPGMTPKRIASLFYKLMTEELGYTKFFAQGGDWGSSITEQIAIQYPASLLGYHMTDIPYYHLFAVPPNDLTAPEKKFMEAGKKWQMTEGGYAMLLSSQPQTLGYGLNDSPAGLASWIIEKFYRWSDCNGSLENCFSKDELLNNLNIYWFTQTINAANRIYYETARQVPPQNFKKIEVPAAITMYPKDLIMAPREYADRIYNVQKWTEMKKGGHFAALEQPELFSEDIREFAGKIAAKSKASVPAM
jgi:pimeloyl-ACP methyl ester carboxylesterase